MNVYLPTVGSDFALSPNDSQNLIDRIDLSLESRFRNKLYPASAYLASARRLAPYGSMYFAGFDV